MKRLIGTLSVGAWMLSLAFAQLSMAQVIVPQSSVERPADVGVRAHTNVRIVVPAGGLALGPEAEQPAAGGPPFPGFLFETPASLACVYELVTTLQPGCNPNTTTVNPRLRRKAANAVRARVSSISTRTAASTR